MNKSNVSSLVKAGNKISFAVLGTLFLLVIYFTLTGFYDNLKTARKAILEQLKGTATAAAMMLDEQELYYLLERINKNALEPPHEDSVFFNTYITLKDLQVRNNLNVPIRVLYYNEHNGQFKKLTSSSDIADFNQIIEDYPTAFLKNYHNGGFIDLYKNSEGEWLTAFSPIKSKNGKTIAIVTVDKPFEEFKSQAVSQLMRDLIISTIVFLIIGFSLYKFISSLINREQRIRKRLIEQNEEIVSQKEEIQQQSNWISKHNNKLEEQAKTIELQNKELKIINQMLDFKVEQRTKELEKANQELSEFLYRSSHDIVGPVATLSGLVNVAEKDLGDPVAQAYLLRMRNTITQLNDVIRSVNVVYEIRNRDLDYRNESINDLIRTTIKSMEHIASKNDVKICIDLDEDIHAAIDDFLLRIALAEIVKNAFSFHKKDAQQTKAIAKVSAGMYKRNKLRIVVEDNGIGIAAGYDKLIFQMFKKAHIESEGTGLGLYLALLAIERLKGKIKFESEEGSGSRFEIIIPVFDRIRF